MRRFRTQWSVDNNGTFAGVVQDYEIIIGGSGLYFAPFPDLLLFLQISFVSVAFPLPDEAVLNRHSVDHAIRRWRADRLWLSGNFDLLWH